MKTTKHLELIHEGDYLAEVEVAWEMPDNAEADDAWAPYLTLADAQKLSDIRQALRSGDLQRAARAAKLYHLTPVSAA